MAKNTSVLMVIAGLTAASATARAEPPGSQLPRAAIQGDKGSGNSGDGDKGTLDLALIPGTYVCKSSLNLGGFATQFYCPQVYGSGGNSDGKCTMTLEMAEVRVAYLVDWAGTWRGEGDQLCEKLTKFDMRPGNELAGSDKGKKFMAILQLIYTRVVDSRTEMCSTLRRLDRKALVTVAPGKNAPVTTCKRKGAG